MYRAFYDLATGRLLSVGSVWPAELPVGMAYAEYPTPPDLDNTAWDEALQDFKARPAKVLVDRLEDLINDPKYADFQTAWNNLSPTRKTALRSAIILFLGRFRYRTPSQDTSLG